MNGSTYGGRTNYGGAVFILFIASFDDDREKAANRDRSLPAAATSFVLMDERSHHTNNEAATTNTTNEIQTLLHHTRCLVSRN